MRRAGPALFLALAAWLAAPVPSSAYPSFAGGRGLFDVRSADVSGPGGVDVQVGGLAYRADETTEAGVRKVDVLDGGLQVAIGLGGLAEMWGTYGAAVVEVDAEGSRAFAPRDGRLGLKLRLADGRVMPGLAVETSLPLGDRSRGFSTDSFDPAVTALLTIGLPESSPVNGARLHANVGWRRHGDTRGRGFEGLPLYFLEPVHPALDRDRLDARLALEFTGQRATLFAELLLDQLQNDGLAFKESPLFLTPGFRYSISESFSLLAVSKITLASDDESTTGLKAPEDLYPNWQVGIALTWSRRGPRSDRDGDGVPDFRDQCPGDPEDRDAWRDNDGCPDPDNDADGVPDAVDGCPNEAETVNGVEDADGCPEPQPDSDAAVTQP